jgi:hypothetical protein
MSHLISRVIIPQKLKRELIAGRNIKVNDIEKKYFFFALEDIGNFDHVYLKY